jgi:molybdate transport system ATP-binding protein
MIAAGDVSLARERPQATTILNVLPARILAASLAGSHEIVAVLGLGPEGAGSRILARVTRLSWDQMQLTDGAEVYAQAKSVALARRNPAARLIVEGDKQNIAVGGS